MGISTLLKLGSLVDQNQHSFPPVSVLPLFDFVALIDWYSGVRRVFTTQDICPTLPKYQIARYNTYKSSRLEGLELVNFLGLTHVDNESHRIIFITKDSS